jgi:outer membrane protein assembly factor BamA
VRLEGYDQVSEEELRKVLFLRSADIYSEEKVQSQHAKLQEVYFNAGYIFAQIRPLPLVNPDTGFVDVTFSITEN